MRLPEKVLLVIILLLMSEASQGQEVFAYNELLILFSATVLELEWRHAKLAKDTRYLRVEKLTEQKRYSPIQNSQLTITN